MYSGKFSYTLKKCGLTAIVVVRAAFVFPLPTAKTLIRLVIPFLNNKEHRYTSRLIPETVYKVYCSIQLRC